MDGISDAVTFGDKYYCHSQALFQFFHLRWQDARLLQRLVKRHG